MCGFQFDPNTKTVLASTKASSSCSALDSRHVGNIAVNPVYPNIVAVANQYYTTNGSSAVMKKYNNKYGVENKEDGVEFYFELGYSIISDQM